MCVHIYIYIYIVVKQTSPRSPSRWTGATSCGASGSAAGPYYSLIADSSDKGSHGQRTEEKQHRVKRYPPDILHGRFQREKYRCAEVAAP